MHRGLIVISCALLIGGCKSAPKSAKVINGANARLLAMLVYDYSTTHDVMPPNLYVLDLSNVRSGDKQARISDLRCVSRDRKTEADFLYFRSSGSFSKVDPNKIVLASPFAPASGEQRLVVTISGATSYVNESEFLRAMSTEEFDGEQAGTGQPATRSQSKSEGGDKPQPEAEGRSR